MEFARLKSETDVCRAEIETTGRNDRTKEDHQHLGNLHISTAQDP